MRVSISKAIASKPRPRPSAIFSTCWVASNHFRVVAGPAWMRTDHYNIEAKAGRSLEIADRQRAVMALVATRRGMYLRPYF